MAGAKTVVLVHGAWHGGWCWDSVSRRLDAMGITNVVVENPSVAQAPADLAADGDNLARVLDAIDGPVLLVGHSYGGAVITDAGAHPNVDHLVYITAFALDEGESLMENNLSGGEGLKLVDVLDFDGDLIHLDAEGAVDFFYNDCDASTVAEAMPKLQSMSLAAMAGAPRKIAWREKPATYVVCSEDRVLPVALQRSNAQRVDGPTLELSTGHSPFLSRPDELAALIAELSA
jgi:pimeloyl-ACP methyl ester carboxylesterase